MRLTLDEIKDKLKELGIINAETNALISFTGFKNRCSVHKYGKKLKIVFLGHPKQNLFGFYVMYAADSVVLKEAYQMLVNVVVKDDISYYEDDDLQWGNAGIPLAYGDLRFAENIFAD